MAKAKHHYEVVLTSYVCENCGEEIYERGVFNIDDVQICPECGHENVIEDIIDLEEV